MPLTVGRTLNDNGKLCWVYECRRCGERTKGKPCRCYMEEVWAEARGEDGR